VSLRLELTDDRQDLIKEALSVAVDHHRTLAEEVEELNEKRVASARANAIERLAQRFARDPHGAVAAPKAMRLLQTSTAIAAAAKRDRADDGRATEATSAQHERDAAVLEAISAHCARGAAGGRR
jgi:hypothetical protein